MSSDRSFRARLVKHIAPDAPAPRAGPLWGAQETIATPSQTRLKDLSSQLEKDMEQRNKQVKFNTDQDAGAAPLPERATPAQLKRELDLRMESYMRREAAYQSELVRLSLKLGLDPKQNPVLASVSKQSGGLVVSHSSLNTHGDEDNILDDDTGLRVTKASIRKLRSMNHAIQEGIVELSVAGRHEIERHDDESLNNFRRKLLDVEDEFDVGGKLRQRGPGARDPNSSLSGGGAKSELEASVHKWASKALTLQKELREGQQEWSRLDAINRNLEDELRLTKRKSSMQAEEYSSLMSKYVSLKAELVDANKRAGEAGYRALKAEEKVAALEAGLGSTDAPVASGPGLPSTVTRSAGDSGGYGVGSVAGLTRKRMERELALRRDEVNRLRQLVETERASSKAMKEAAMRMRHKATRVQEFVLGAIADVRTATTEATKPAIEDDPEGKATLTANERAAVLTKLAEQDRLLHLLYEHNRKQVAGDLSVMREAERH